MAALFTVAMGAMPATSTGQECPEGRISSIQVVRLDVFDLEEFQEGSFIRGVFKTANAIQILKW